MLFPVFLSAAVLVVWITILVLPGRFWVLERLSSPPEPSEWPAVIAVIPARQEALLIGETLRSLWQQDYPAGVKIVLVDDQSTDGTADSARSTAIALGRERDFVVVEGAPPPAEWAGKVWAMQQGLDRALGYGSPDYVLFSDADISHGPGTLRELVSRAEEERYDLVSLMVRLQCDTPAEKLMIPAFVYFFRMLYPFRRVNDPRDRIAGAAGGTMLVRRSALLRIGGLHSIRGALIDDCSIAREIKRGGHPIWLGLSRTSRSTRGYGRMAEIVQMIARSAYTQLGYSPLRLIGSVVGLALVFLAPPIVTVLMGGPASLVAGAAWLLMSISYAPMLKFYGQSPFLAPVLPITAALYLWATMVSAWRHHRGVGGAWKGRLRPRT